MKKKKRLRGLGIAQECAQPSLLNILWWTCGSMIEVTYICVQPANLSRHTRPLLVFPGLQRTDANRDGFHVLGYIKRLDPSKYRRHIHISLGTKIF